MATTKYIRIPFASDGDTTPIPNETQSDGTLSWAQGWGPDYQRDLSDDANAKAIERDTMNQLFSVLSTIAQWYQQHAIPEFITSDQNNGQAYSYSKGASVVYTDSSGAQTYWTSIKDNNTATPGGDGWKPYLFRTASTSEITNKQGDYPVTPQQVIDLINNTVTFPDATTSQKGIVQLNDGVNSTSVTQAATPNAVSQKLTHFKNGLDTQNLDDLKAFNQRAVYYQTNADLATTDRNYPVQAAGVLLCLGQVNNAVMQFYYGENGSFHSRSMNSSNNQYNPWREITPVIQDATTSQKGVVQLSNSLTGSSQTLAATELAVSQKFNYANPDLGTRNLNNLTGTAGVFYQKEAGRATGDRNYPTASAGQLVLTTASDGFIQQSYLAANGNVYIRTRSAANEDWSLWQTVPPGMPTGAFVTFALPPGASAPSGYYVCSGGLLNRADEPALFNFIGTRFNTGGESDDQFRLPNVARGYALVSNNGLQQDNITTTGAVISHGHSGTTSTAGEHTHTRQYAGSRKENAGAGILVSTNNFTPSFRANKPAGAHTHDVIVADTGGPNNLAAGLYGLVCIKA